MKDRLQVFNTFVCAILLILIPVVVSAANASRIELSNGTVFENVAFKINAEYKVITIEQGNDKRNISFSDITLILDSSGRNITNEALGLDDSPRVGTKRLPFSLAIHAQPNYSLPIGDYYQGFAPGIGYGFDIVVPVSREIAIRGTVSRSGMRPDNHSPGESFGAWRYLVSVEYYKWPRWRQDGRTMYSIYTGIGGISHTFSNHVGSATIGNFTTTLGLGLMQQVSKNMGIEAGWEFDLIYVGTTGSDSYYFYHTQYAWIMDFKLGIVFLL